MNADFRRKWAAAIRDANGPVSALYVMMKMDAARNRHAAFEGAEA